MPVTFALPPPIWLRFPRRSYDRFMTINLHARTDFKKGDAGRVSGHIVARVDTPKNGERLAVALQDVRAGENGWFEVQAA